MEPPSFRMKPLSYRKLSPSFRMKLLSHRKLSPSYRMTSLSNRFCIIPWELLLDCIIRMAFVLFLMVIANITQSIHIGLLPTAYRLIRTIVVLTLNFLMKADLGEGWKRYPFPFFFKKEKI